jgi:hypothetical protein
MTIAHCSIQLPWRRQCHTRSFSVTRNMCLHLYSVSSLTRNMFLHLYTVSSILLVFCCSSLCTTYTLALHVCAVDAWSCSLSAALYTFCWSSTAAMCQAVGNALSHNIIGNNSWSCNIQAQLQYSGIDCTK